MARDKPVGISHRTPLKHWILNTLLGKVVGVGGTRKTDSFANFSKYGLSCVDICAGDGTIVKGEHTSSPYLIHKHCWYAMNRLSNTFNSNIVLIEKQQNTANMLRSSISTYDMVAPYCIIEGDAREYVFEPLSPTQPYFINADPNHIDELPIPSEFSKRITPATTFVATLGCNVGGLKRLPFERRMMWFEYVDVLSRNVPHWHDIVICSIDGDSSQWAYMFRIPNKWRCDYMNDILTAAKKFGFRLTIASLKRSNDRFSEVINKLFLTRNEADGNGKT